MPEERWALQFDVSIAHQPPVIWINHLTDAYLNIPAKFLEALVVCRTVSGSDQNIDIDFMCCEPAGTAGRGRPHLHPRKTPCPSWTRRCGPFAEIWGEGRLILALCFLGQLDDDPVWFETAKRKVDRLLELSVEREDYRFLLARPLAQGRFAAPDADEPGGPIPDGSLGDKYDGT